MKNLVLLLVLVHTQTIKTSTLPFIADTRTCPSAYKYLKDDSTLCCNKCPPGQKLKTDCTETTDTACEPCRPDQYMENWNYAKNCASCIRCKQSKGLQYAQNCSSTTKAKCVCMPGWFCLMGDNDNCQDCKPYKTCKPGLGVSVPGTAMTDVKCKKCPEGTFSDTVSSTDACKPHTTCNPRDVIINGNTTSDTVCKTTLINQPRAPKLRSVTVIATIESPLLSATTVKSKLLSWQPTNSTTASSLSKSTTGVYNVTKSHVAAETGNKQLAAVIGGVTAIFVLITVIVLLVLCKQVFRKDALRDCPKVDANGNCDTDSDNTNHCYLGDTQSLSFKAVQPEQQCLLKNKEPNQNEPISSTNVYNNISSVGPLLSTLPLHQPLSALSEPMPLQSSADHVVSQMGATTQSSSQPNSPQNITPSPLVNVNINLHIGNGTCGSPAVMLNDVIPTERVIPFGEEEESRSLLQQEDGKPSLLSVEESGTFSCHSLKTQDQFE